MLTRKACLEKLKVCSSAPPARTRRALVVMAFDGNKAARMIQATKTYISAWKPEVMGGEAAKQPTPRAEVARMPPAGPKEVPTRLEALLCECVSPQGITFLPDGVVHQQTRVKTPRDLAVHIMERSEAYEHLEHEDFAVAVNEEENEAFVGVRYRMKNVGPILGHEATERTSSGVILERLGFNTQGQICTALVCRQLTYEEIEALTHNPAAVHVPMVRDEDLFLPVAALGAAEIATMDRSIKGYIMCWDMESTEELDRLEQFLDPQVVMLSAYGLGKHSVPFAGAAGGRGAIRAAHERIDNRNHLISHAVCKDRRAGFAHWRANCLDGTTRRLETEEGLDFYKFNTAGQIEVIVSFTMRPYANLKSSQEARNMGVD